MNYTLKNQSGILGRVSLYKSSYKLGEDVTGTMDLGGASISCLQVRERRWEMERVGNEIILLVQCGSPMH